MLFSVIYSVDIPNGVNMRPYVPPDCKKLWDETEDDSSYDYGYLEGCWEKGHHRKWCAILTQEQFEEFIDHVGLFAENVQTMGSIGAPGYGCGWAPAISFRNDDPDAIQSAYVTPSGTKEDIIAFLREHEESIPLRLLDAEGQQYLFDDAEQLEADAQKCVWESVRSIVIEQYS